AVPTRCTSLGPRWRNTCAASASPRDSSRIAALSTLLSLVAIRASLIGVDPLFDDLGHSTRVLGYQILDGIQLRVVSLGRARQHDALRPTQTDPVIGQPALFVQVAQLVVTADRLQLLALAGIGQVVEYRTQHAKHQHQDEQHAEHLLDDVPEPGLRIERWLFEGIVEGVWGKGCVD